jgi:hypothetical protein
MRRLIAFFIISNIMAWLVVNEMGMVKGHDRKKR